MPNIKMCIANMLLAHTNRVKPGSWKRLRFFVMHKVTDSYKYVKAIGNLREPMLKPIELRCKWKITKNWK